MSTNSANLHRRSIRLQEYDYAQPGGYFVTMCTHEHKCLFGNVQSSEVRLSDLGQIVDAEWRRTSQIRPEVALDTFVTMPNHMHAILFVAGEAARPIFCREGCREQAADR